MRITRLVRKGSIIGWRRMAMVCAHRLKEPFCSYYLRYFYKSCADKNYQHNKTLSESMRLTILSDLIAKNMVADHDRLLTQADNYVRGMYTLFGHDFVISDNNRAWHDDMRCMGDVKFSWELSRSNHVVILAYAYHQTGNRAYADSCISFMHDWIAQHRYHEGIAWYNGLEVALRMMQWITALVLIGPVLYEYSSCALLIASLHDHARYIRCHWELYDGRTNNHYYANLVGYLYYAFFFGHDKDLVATFKTIIEESCWQIDSDGVSYEGSTRYHVFVNELAACALLIAQAAGDTYRSYAYFLHNLCGRMAHFSAACTPSGSTIVIIGDDDSATVVHGAAVLATSFKNEYAIARADQRFNSISYKNFGLTIIHNHAIHCTFRHHAYRLQQPTAHFHSDILSITLTWHNKVIFTDPGTYTYTRSPLWRNYFRHHKQHTTFAHRDYDPVCFTQDIFYCPLTPQEASYDIQQSVSQVTITGYHDLYRQSLGLRAWRSLTVAYDEREGHIVVTCIDWWESFLSDAALIRTEWAFIGGLDCTFVPHDSGVTILCNGQKIGLITSDLTLKGDSVFISPRYSTKVPAQALRAHKDIRCHDFQKTVITLLP